MGVRPVTGVFEAELARLDARQERLTGGTLAAADLSWPTRFEEVRLRVACAFEGGGAPDPALLAVAGAHLLACYEAAVEAQMVRVESGEAA